MSLSATLISAFHALQGSEINVRPPSQFILYLSGNRADPVPTAVLSLDLINDSADQGDVITDASMTIDGADAAFPFNGSVRFAPGADASKCSFGSSCAPVSGFLVETDTDTLIELPKGSARNVTLSFPFDPAACSGRQCNEYASFEKVRAAFSSKQLEFIVHLRFHGDGQRTISCRVAQIDTAYLARASFTSMPCTSASVSGAPFL